MNALSGSILDVIPPSMEFTKIMHVFMTLLLLSALRASGNDLKFASLGDVDDGPGWGMSWADVYGSFREISNLEMIQPHEYSSIADVRFILLTKDKPSLLAACLKALNDVHVDDSRAELHIWIDKSDLGSLMDAETRRIAQDFVWSKGPTFVHLRETHVGVYNQWISTWRSHSGSKEIGVFLEDHVLVSPYFYRWIKTMHGIMGNQTDISGYCPSGADTHLNHEVDGVPVYLYRGLTTTAFVPHPVRWHEFQHWFYGELTKIKSGEILPYIPEDKESTMQYRLMEREHDEINMWSQWYRYFCYMKNLWSVNPNIPRKTLALNRYARVDISHSDTELMKRWDDDYVPKTVIFQRFDYDGKEIRN